MDDTVRGVLWVVIASLAWVGVSCGDGKGGEAPAAPLLVQWSLAGELVRLPPRDVLDKATSSQMASLLPAVAALNGAELWVVGSLDGSAGEVVLVLEGRVKGKGVAPVIAGVAATGSADSADQALEIVSQGLASLKRALSQMFALIDQTPPAWVAALKSVEPDIQILACRLLARDKVTSAVPAVAALLADERLPVAEAAAEALVQIGDRGAIPLVIGSVRRGDLRSEVRAIEVLGALGGGESRAYLEMIAGGHEIPEVRRIAQQALGRRAHNSL